MMLLHSVSNALHKTFFSSEKGVFITEFFYRMEKELCLSFHPQTGVAEPMFVKIPFEHSAHIEEDTLTRWHESLSPLYSILKDWKDESLLYVSCISEVEYMQKK